MSTPLSRRTLLEAGASGVVGTALGAALPLSAVSAATGREGLRALSVPQAKNVMAIAERIWPGASEAGVLTYIDRALATAYAGQVQSYRRGLTKLDAAARRRFGAVFIKIAPEQQDALLAALEANELDELPEPHGRAFFELLRSHVMEGVLSDPIYGGNRDFAGWRAVGYPGPYRGYTAEQQMSTAPLDLPYQSIKDL